MPEKVLRLESIAGAEPMEYVWPLTAGRGSLRGAEDEHDQACEIVESIKWVGHDFSQVLDSMGNLLNSFDRHDWNNMNDIVTTFNTAVKAVREKEKKREATRPSRQMLRHILQQVYNTAICDPNELNHYEPFTPEVYGETSFELINQMIDQISPINNDNKFLDLGSGVGQVVLQVAALTDCQLCVGIEKAIIPSGRAVVMDELFRKWMAWYGKKYSPYKLYQGDFLTPEHRKTISESTIVFVNNYAFGPEVDHMLKERFADLKDGARIVSSKPFCPLNFRITERNLSDIGTIMHVSVMDPLQGSVSWTDKPVSYYLHLIDSTKLERYFTKQQSHHSTRSRRTGHSLLDMDSGSNGSRSRASSLEKELGPDSPLLTSGSGDDSETGVKKSGRGSRGGRSKKRFTKKKSTPRIDGRLSKVTHFLKTLEGVEDMETTPDTSVPPSRGDSPRHSDSPDTGGSAGSGRPVREAVINAAAITEAQNDIYNNIGKRTTKMRGRGKYKHLNEGDRLPRQTKPNANIKKAGVKKTVSGLDELDQMHQETMSKINEYNESAVLPTGCTTEKLSILPPNQIFHEEMPFHLQSGEDKIPHGLHILLETMKKQYLAMIQTMQSKQYSDSIIKEIEREKAKKESLHKRIKQLETQIDGLIKDSLKLLKARISRLGVETESPLEFIKHANTIVSSHSQLLEKKDGLQDEIKRLEQEQKELVERKEKELLEQLISQRSGGDVNLSELRSYVQREIWNCLETRGNGAPNQPMLEHRRNNSGHANDIRETSGSSGPLPKLSSEVTLTKVGAPEKLKEKEKDNSFTLPRMELKLPGENSYSYAEERSNQLADRQEKNNHGMVDPRNNQTVVDARNGGKSGLSLSDDYEDRVKMIITAELNKEGEKKTSPIKDNKLMQEPGRRPAQNGPSPRSRLDSDPRFHTAPDYRYNSSGNMPPDSRYRGGGGVPHDLRRTPSDPRLISPHGSSGDSRLISPHERRLISPHHNLPPVSSSDGGRLVSPQSELPQGARYSGPSQLDVRAAGHRLGSGPFMDQRQFPTSESNSVDVSRVPDSGSRLPGVPDLGPRIPGAPDARNSHPLSSQDLIDMSVEKALANSNTANSSSGGSQGSRMSMVIEDSIRKEKEEKQRMVYSAVVKSDSMNEGLAVPRGGSGPGSQQPPRPSSTDRKPGPAILPQVEGLAARFDSYLEKTKEKPGSRGSANTTGSHNTSGEGLGARFSSPDNLPPNTGSNNTASFTSRPPSTCSKSSLHTPDLADAPPRDSADKKRVGSPLLSPVSVKSQRLDDEGGGGGGSNGGSSNSSSGGKKRDSEEAKRWQDEISMGFDRLVAMASEVDKRRKSTENSPAQGSPRKPDTGVESGSAGSGPQSGGRAGSDIRMLQDSNPFDQQTLAMKIKAGLMQGGDSGSGGNKGKGGGGDWGGGYPPSRGEQNLPGENLPEHHFKKKYFNQEYLRQQQEERARDPVNMTASRDRFPPGPGYNKGVPSTKQGDTYRGSSTGGPASTSTSGPLDMYPGQRPPPGGPLGSGGPPGSMGPGGPPGGGSLGPGGPPGSYGDNRGRPPVSMAGMRGGPGQGDPYGDNRNPQRGGPGGGGPGRGGPGGGQVPDSRSLSSTRLQDYRRFDSSGAAGSGDRWGPNGPPPISSTGSSGAGPNGMGPQQGTGGGGNYDQRLDLERRRRWEEQQQQVARGMPDPREQMSREQIARGMQDPREQMSRGMPDPRDQMSRSMQDPREQMSREQMSRSMPDPREQMAREQMSRSMQDPREQAARAMVQDPRAAMFEGRGNTRMMVPPGANNSSNERQLYQGYGGPRDFDRGGGRPPGPRMPGMGPRGLDPGPRMPGMGPRGPDPGSQVGPRGRDPGMQTRPSGHPDSAMQGRGPAHPQQGYYNQQMMQAMSYRHQQMMYGAGPGGPGGPGGPVGPGGPGGQGGGGGPPRSQQPNN